MADDNFNTGTVCDFPSQQLPFDNRFVLLTIYTS